MANEKPPRVHRQWEEEMLGEYLAKFHPECRVLTRVKLGPTETFDADPSLTPEERKLLGTIARRWVDAVCIEAGTLFVIEAAMRPDPRDISLLLHYLELFDMTPELAEFRQLPRQGLLVWAVDDPISRSLAVRMGLQVRVYKPSFFSEWLSTVRAGETRPSRIALLRSPA